MRHLKVNSQPQTAVRRTIGTRNSKEIPAKTAQNDRNNIGKRIGAGSMPRTRRSATQANTPSSAVKTTAAVTSSSQSRIARVQNGNDQPRSRGEMESLLKKRDEAMPCMTGSDRVANWKSTQFAIDYYRNEVAVSPRRQSVRSVQKSSIQERISYGKVSSSTSFGDNSPSSYDFKVPTSMQRNDNSAELIDLTDDASESNTSSITTTQEELYSYLGVVTKSQTNKVETETENKTVKRSSLRVKVKQIALRNQEIYNQLETNRKLEAANNHTQSLVRYNGYQSEQSSVQVKPQNGDPRLNHYKTNHQHYTQTTYKSTTLVNNTTNSQSSRNNYRTVTTSRVSQQHQQHLSSNQLVPYSFQSSRVRNTTNKCTVMERFVYKPQQPTDSRPIQVNADKYKTSILSSTTSNTTTVNRPANGQPPIGSRPAKISPTRKPEMARPSERRPPLITAGIKRKAMEQWIELSSSHPTTANNIPSKPNTSSSSFASLHQQNTITTTNISTHRKMQKLDVSVYVKNIGSTTSPASSTFQTNYPSNGSNVSPHRKIQIDSRKTHVQSVRTVQNTVMTNGSTLQQNNSTKNARGVEQPTGKPSIQSPLLRNIRPANALTLQTCSQKNIGNNRVSKRRITPKLSSEMKRAMIHEAHTRQNVVVVNNVMPPRKVENVNSRSVPPGKVYLPHTTDKDNISSMQMNQQRNVSSSNNVSPNKFTTYDPRVSLSSMPVTQNIAVSKVSSMQASSKQYITSTANDVAIEVMVHSNFNSKRATSMQMRAIENIETPGSALEKNTQQNVDNKKMVTGGDMKNIDLNKRLSVQLTQLRPIIPTSPSNSHQNTNSNASGIVTPVAPKQKIESGTSTTLQLIQSHSMQNILLLPTSSMESKNAFQPPIFDVQSEIEITSTDLNENVESKPDIPLDLSASISDVIEAKRDSKTVPMDDAKPCLTIVDENMVNESDCADLKPLETIETIKSTNFLQKRDGDVLAVLSFDKQFAVIQERLISLWTQSSDLFSVFGIAQQYDCIGKIERYNCDIEIGTPSYQHRLLLVGSKTFYVELRAKKLIGAYTRESLMSVYLTLYSLNDQQQLILRHIELDRVHGSIPSIRYTILPKSRSFVISWFEAVTNIRKYNLSANMLNLESVHIYPGCREPLKKLQFFENDTVIAFGNSTITMWDIRSGDITCKIDTNTTIGDNLHFFSLIENTERALFLVQSCADPVGNGQLIKLLAINMNNNYSWKVICTHKMPSNESKVTSMATIANHFITTYENGQSFLLNLYNPRQFVVRSLETRGLKCFATNDKIIVIDHNQLISKTFVDHFFA
ncbi:mucin-17-like [Bradysia coprophila]|uniref:mucin-17-like n=1 Tax=Bradysia coprophila TaxID=38358 RepID=UPI00187D9259|nr:mucin-17-like [Bradysia coprophila]